MRKMPDAGNVFRFCLSRKIIQGNRLRKREEKKGEKARGKESKFIETSIAR